MNFLSTFCLMSILPPNNEKNSRTMKRTSEEKHLGNFGNFRGKQLHKNLDPKFLQETGRVSYDVHCHSRDIANKKTQYYPHSSCIKLCSILACSCESEASKPKLGLNTG